MIKIPGTAEGLPAITRCLADGININVTLLFSVSTLRGSDRGFLRDWRSGWRGASRSDRIALGGELLREPGRRQDRSGARRAGRADALRGTAAIANACAAYAAFERARRHAALAGARGAGGARPQRPLWASTSTKDPKYPDVYYVEALIAPHTVNTLPPATFAAYKDHGKPAMRIREGMTVAPRSSRRWRRRVSIWMR